MTIKVTEALDSDTANVVTLEDVGPSTRVNGRPVYPAPTTRKALSSTQQPTPDQLNFLEGGERTKELLSFYLNKVVQTSKSSTGEPATTIIRKGKRYKVVFAGDWEDFGWFFAIGAREQ